MKQAKVIVPVILIIIISFAFLFTLNGNENPDAMEQNENYFRCAVVVDEFVKLDNNNTYLYNGDVVNVDFNRCTEEGIYVVIENDSGAVYYQYLEYLVWLKEDAVLMELRSGKDISFTKDDYFIMNDFKEDAYILESKGRLFSVGEGKITFDNQKFYEEIKNRKDILNINNLKREKEKY